jgi:hypothetical protein
LALREGSSRDRGLNVTTIDGRKVDLITPEGVPRVGLAPAQRLAAPGLGHPGACSEIGTISRVHS